MKTRAAVLRTAGTPWEITELDLDAPQAYDVLIRMEAAGLGHADEHIRPKGPGVTRVKVGDRVSTELISKKYALDEINDGYQDLMDGKNIRGVVVHSGS